MVKRLAMVTVAVVLAGSMAGRAEARGADTDTRLQGAVEKEAIELIADVEEVGRDVLYHVERLASFPAPGESYSRWIHYHHLEEVKMLINDHLRPALKRLTEVQPQLADWKQGGIDRMLASARELAADTSTAIFTKADKAGKATAPPAMNEDYRKLVDGMTTHAEALVQTADAAHAFAVAHLKAVEVGLQVQK